MTRLGIKQLVYNRCVVTCSLASASAPSPPPCAASSRATRPSQRRPAIRRSTRNQLDEAKAAEAELLRRYEDGTDATVSDGRPPKVPAESLSAAQLLKACAQRGVESRRAVERSAKAAAELSAALGDSRRQLGEMEARITAQELDYERRVTELQRGHAKRVKELLRQAHITAIGAAVEAGEASPALADGASPGDTSVSLRDSIGELSKLRDARINAVEKDNVFYKQTNRELKRKLRSMLNATEAERAAFEVEREAMRNRSRELEEVNSSLLNEVRVIKESMRQSGQLVRVSMQNLRPMSADEVSQLRSGQAARSPARAVTAQPDTRTSGAAAL